MFAETDLDRRVLMPPVYLLTVAVVAAALFELTGRQVPSRETKTYLGAGLAVLGVNLVSTRRSNDAMSYRNLAVHAV